MLTAIIACAVIVVGFTLAVTGFAIQHHRARSQDSPYLPGSWRSTGEQDPIDWLREYPGRPEPPPLDRMQYRPRHGALIGVDAYWEPTRAYRIITGRRRVAWGKIFTPVRVEFSRFRRPPSRLGHWKIVGGLR